MNQVIYTYSLDRLHHWLANHPMIMGIWHLCTAWNMCYVNGKPGEMKGCMQYQSVTAMTHSTPKASWRCCCILNAHHRSLVWKPLGTLDITLHRAPKFSRPFFGVCFRFPYIHHFKREVSPSGWVPFRGQSRIAFMFCEWKPHDTCFSLLKIDGFLKLFMANITPSFWRIYLVCTNDPGFVSTFPSVSSW